ncbi:MAG: transposase [Candidatus Sulfotelmatobacter sp.]|jgi:REP element-mobilizing transposase RayT
MAHTYVFDLVHCVFSTKEHRNAISREKLSELWSYLGGIARNNGFKAIAFEERRTTSTILQSLPATVPLAKAMQLLKGGSSKWMNDTGGGDLAWQEGYGAFTVGISQQAKTTRYNNSRAEPHRSRAFEDELLAFLKKHGTEYDPKYVWG